MTNNHLTFSHLIIQLQNILLLIKNFGSITPGGLHNETSNKRIFD
jgi:hypothetical protein